MSASALLGVSGVRRNACAAVYADGEVRAVCEQERLTRIRRVGFGPNALPAEAVEQVLTLASRGRGDISSYLVAEPEVRLPETMPTTAIDHHHAHAATAFLTSPFQHAAVIVCDSTAGCGVTVWRGEGGDVRPQEWAWSGYGFATLYSECARLFPFADDGCEHQLEAVAHLGRGTRLDEVRPLFHYDGGSLQAAPGWRRRLHDLITDELDAGTEPIGVADAVQRRIGELLLEFVADVRAALDCDTLCVGGGLFYNTYFTTLLCRSGLFKNVFVPISPGNPGLAVGATLLAAGAARTGTRPGLSPFLGPAYDDETVKATLDGCKLSYAFVSSSQAVDAAVAALTRGHLVGWFDGRMEWGHRSLGHRSILADPCSPYVLDNLNTHLRKRPRWRAFGVSVCEDAAPGLLCGPAASPFMQYQYGVRDDRLRHVLPSGATSLRVQTVAPELGTFWTLHKRMEQATGTAALVNTSFNGFHEPIVCSPRDAIRVFYGTGLDMLVMGRFILSK